MKRLAFFAAAFLATGAVRDLQSVKSDAYQTYPTRITVAALPLGFSDEFRESLSRKMAECGVALSIYPMADAQAQLQIAQTVWERGEGGTQFQPFMKMRRYEFTLVDLATHQNVWKSQGDFDFDKPKSNPTDEHEAAAHRGDAWAEDIVGQMRRDKLIERCDASVAITPPDIPKPGAPKPLRISVGGITYPSIEDAEAGLRAAIAVEVAKLPVETEPARGGVLVVLPHVQSQTVNLTGGAQSPADMAPMLAFTTAISRIGNEAGLDALRRANMFTEVVVADADDGDFHGESYKIYLAPGKPPLRWTLLRRDGESRPLPQGPGGLVTQESLAKWVAGVKAALDEVGR